MLTSSCHLLDWVTMKPVQVVDSMDIMKLLMKIYGISLGVKGLRLCFPMQVAGIQSLVRELRSHKPHGKKKHKTEAILQLIQ